MHLIYSALSNQTENQNPEQHELLLRYRAYLDACQKHREMIAQIQKHFPGWVPRFR